MGGVAPVVIAVGTATPFLGAIAGGDEYAARGCITGHD